jgi:Zn-dependent protease with chaperone function
MRQYSTFRWGLYFAGTTLGFAVALAVLGLGWSAKIRDRVEQRLQGYLPRVFGFYAWYYGAVTLLTLPYSFVASFLLGHWYGVSTQPFAGWVLDRLKQYGVTVILTGSCAAFVLWLIRRWPAGWWWRAWLAFVPASIAAVMLAPLVLDPIYNRFEPLPESALRARILEMAAGAGIAESRIFRVDASQRTRSLNAYVTGIGGTARIVLWDTLLRKLDDDEVLAIMAHEMGHYVEHHVPLGLAAGAAGTLFLLAAIGRGAGALFRRCGTAWKLRALSDPAAIPLLLLCLNVGLFLTRPIQCAVSRFIEARADEFALRHAPDRLAVASALVKLSEEGLSDPYPPAIIEFWVFTHPPLGRRIERALDRR